MPIVGELGQVVSKKVGRSNQNCRHCRQDIRHHKKNDDQQQNVPERPGWVLSAGVSGGESWRGRHNVRRKLRRLWWQRIERRRHYCYFVYFNFATSHPFLIKGVGYLLAGACSLLNPSTSSLCSVNKGD